MRDQHRQQMQPRPAALSALDKRELRRAFRPGNDQAHAFRLNPCPAHGVAELQQPRRRKDGTQPPAVLRTRAQAAIQSASGQSESLRESARVVSGLTNPAPCAVYGGLVTTSCTVSCPITAPASRQSAQCTRIRSSRPLSATLLRAISATSRLHLKRVERRPLCPCAEQQRQNARPRAHVADTFAPVSPTRNPPAAPRPCQSGSRFRAG